MAVKISTSNSKLGIIPSINLPPIVTCRPNCPCAKECYALKGHFRFPNVKEAMAYNLQRYLTDPKGYFEDVRNYLSDGVRTHQYFRWHSAGDIVDERYFTGMIDTAKTLKTTEFLAFTKKFELVNQYITNGGQIPANLHIIFSAWGDTLPMENPSRFPVAYVRFGNENDRNIPKDAIECSGNCTDCLQCWNMEHGQSVFFNKH